MLNRIWSQYQRLKKFKRITLGMVLTRVTLTLERMSQENQELRLVWVMSQDSISKKQHELKKNKISTLFPTNKTMENRDNLVLFIWIVLFSDNIFLF